MTRIDFYILEDGSPEARHRFVCRLAEKAHQQGHRIYIYAAEAGKAAAVDELLWTFRDGSFVPHDMLRAGETPDRDTPIHVGSVEPPAQLDDVLVTLGEEVPAFFSRFHRVAEVIAGDEAARAGGRARFRFYRDRGYPLETHTIPA
jgi:DNA polymerase-3 subunit chi